MRYLPNVGLLLGHHPQRWPNIKQTMAIMIFFLHSVSYNEMNADSGLERETLVSTLPRRGRQ